MNKKNRNHHVFDLESSHNHLIITVGEVRVLLDTGSPYSFRMQGGPDRLVLGGREIPLLPMPVRAAAMQQGMELLGTSFGVLLGMDAMKSWTWDISWEAGKVRVTPSGATESFGTWLPLEPSLGKWDGSCPSFRAEGGQSRVLLDTGAELSYVVGSIPPTAVEVDSSQDYNPILGLFESPVWEDSLELHGHTIPIRFGRLPAAGETLLRGHGARWVVGRDLTRSFRVILSFPTGRLGLLAHEGGVS